jgi:hypothetical protein
MIPWRITVSTDYSPEKVIEKINRLIEPDDSDSELDAFDDDHAMPKCIRSFFRSLFSCISVPWIIGDFVDFSKHSFRLVQDPGSFFYQDLYFATVYQGHTEYVDGRCQIIIWVRREIVGVLAISLILLFLTLLLIIYTISGQMSWSVFITWALASGFALFNTFRDVREARELFEKLFPDRDRQILDKVS